VAVLDPIHVLFPHFAGLVVEHVARVGRSVRVFARGRAAVAACPGCGGESARVHSRYERRVADSPVGGQELVVHLRVRRFFCDTADCARRTFAEQVPGLTVRHGRSTELLRRMWEAVATALGGRAGPGSPRTWRRQSAGARCCASSAPVPTRLSARCGHWG